MRVEIDPRFMMVCESGTVCVSGSSSDSTLGMGLTVKDGHIVIRRGLFNRSTSAVITLAGVRKGFLNKRFPNRTKEQFDANEKFINSAYPST